MQEPQIKTILISQIDASYHEDSCFHYLELIENSDFLRSTPVYVSEHGLKLYGNSLSVFHSLKKFGADKCFAFIVPGDYTEKFDMYLNNIQSNVTLLYHKIKKLYPEAVNLTNCEFDINQLDLMYLVELDDESMDVRELAEETVKIKKQFNVTIVLKTLEHNFLIQKFFKTNKNEITFNDFNRVVNKIVGPFDDEPEERFYRNNTYPDFIIKCDTYEQLNEVLDFFKINKDKVKTTRLNFKKIEKCIV